MRRLPGKTEFCEGFPVLSNGDPRGVQFSGPRIVHEPLPPARSPPPKKNAPSTKDQGAFLKRFWAIPSSASRTGTALVRPSDRTSCAPCGEGHA